MTHLNSKRLPLSEVEPGAELAESALGVDGQVLMTAGSILSEAVLEKLAARGVLELAVKVANQRDEAELAAAREALHKRLEYLFRRCDMENDSGPARAIFQAVLDYRLESLR